jgi:S-formylglutathione hydrolase FrmB
VGGEAWLQPVDATAAFFPGCNPPVSGPLDVRVGTVTCQEVPSADLGGVTAFSYYVPPQCAPAVLDPSGRRCPVLYLLHGFGGDYTSELGTASAPSAMVAALDAGPPVDPNEAPDPWDYADPSTWVKMSPIDFILVAPDGRTVPGGYGPAPGLDGFFMDWNPRYARGGDEQVYDTPPPRFEASLLGELIPYVDANFPVGRGRDWQALQGTSLGGFGAYKDGLQHPDEWASIGSISGALNFLVAPGLQPSSSVTGPSPLHLSPPGGIPSLAVPGVVSAHVPVTSLPAPVEDFGAALYALGDPVADQAYYRGNMPTDLAMNGHAFAGDVPSLDIRGFSNDAVPRQASDVEDPQSYASAQLFEALVLDMNLQMEAAFAAQGVPNSYQLHPGIHSNAYWNPFLRQELAGQYAHVMHPDGGGSPPPAPATFDYRSIATRFQVWGWKVSVSRPDVDFLDMTDVSCGGLTLQGTGVVTVTVPAACGTGYRGSRHFTVDLGPSAPVDDGPDAAAVPAYGGTAQVTLTSRWG